MCKQQGWLPWRLFRSTLCQSGLRWTGSYAWTAQNGESDEEAFAELLAQKTDKELLREQKHDEEELQKAIVRNDTVAQLYEKLYEDNATGKVSDEWFMQLSHKY